MAIKDHLEVFVSVDGMPAPEFDDESSNDSPSTVSKYIEIRSEARFAFKLWILSTYTFTDEDALTFKIYIDGKRAGGVVCTKERFEQTSGYGYFVKVNSCLVGTGEDLKKLKFRFADLKTRDTTEDDIETLKEKYNELGCLEVRVRRDRVLGHSKGSHLDRHREDDEVVPEKALKGRAIDVAAKMEEVPGAIARPFCITEGVDKNPFVTFRFHYRTRASLQSEMIIPRTPSPQEKEDLAQMEQLAVKKENDLPKLKRDRPVSPVAPWRPLKTTKTNDGKIVYHIDDSDEETTLPSPPVTRPVEPVGVIDLL